MNKIEKGKKGLSVFGIVLIVLAVTFGVLGVLGVVFGALKINVPFIVGGVVGLILSAFCIIYGITFVWTASALVATKGSIAEENLGVGTINQEKCQKCGMSLDPETHECPNHKAEK